MRDELLQVRQELFLLAPLRCARYAPRHPVDRWKSMPEKLRTSFQFAECVGHRFSANPRFRGSGRMRHTGSATIARSMETCRDCTRAVPEASSLSFLTRPPIQPVWKKEEEKNFEIRIHCECYIPAVGRVFRRRAGIDPIWQYQRPCRGCQRRGGSKCESHFPSKRHQHHEHSAHRQGRPFPIPVPERRRVRNHGPRSGFLHRNPYRKRRSRVGVRTPHRAQRCGIVEPGVGHGSSRSTGDGAHTNRRHHHAN